MKAIFLLVSICLLGACSADPETHWVTLDTQGQSEGRIAATRHSVSVSFSHQAVQQEQTTNALKKRIAAFESWAKDNGFSVSAQQHDLRPVYEYIDGKGRQLMAYKASQGFIIESLSAADYQVVLQQLPRLKPEQFRLSKVVATSQDQKALKERLISEAYAAAEHSAETMQQAAGLCALEPQSVSVQSNRSMPPMMMRMEAADQGSMHKNQVEEEHSMTLNVTWRAQVCQP